MAGLDPKYMRIKIPKTAHEDKSYPSMSVSLDLGCIPSKKQTKNVSETSITGNKVTQDPDDTNKEAKVGISIWGTKQTSVCVTQHPSGLTPTSYKNNKAKKLVQMIRHMIPIRVKLVFL